MRLRLGGGLLLLCFSLLLPGCALPGGEGAPEKKEEKKAQTRLVSVPDVSPYLEMPSLSGRSFEKTPTQEEIEAFARRKALRLGGLSSQEPVEEGDTVLINYVVTEGHVTVEGGLANNYVLTVGSGEMVPGFEEALLGMREGETKAFSVEDAEIRVTVQQVEKPNLLTEEWAAGMGYESLAAFMDSAREELSLTYEGEALRRRVFRELMGEARVLGYPEEDMEKAREDFADLMERYAQLSGMERDEFLESQGLTGENYEAAAESYARGKVANDLLLQGLVEELGIDLSDSVSGKVRESLAETYAKGKEKTLLQDYGEEAVLESVAYERVMDMLLP